MKNWDALGEDARFRKLPLYAMRWDVSDVELLSGQVLGAPMGGPLCVLRQSALNQNQLEIYLFSQGGDFLQMFSPRTTQDKHGLAKGGAGFANDSLLQLVTTNGVMTMVDLCACGAETQLSLNKSITLCCMNNGYVLCLASDGALILIAKGKVLLHLVSRHVKPLVISITCMSFYLRETAESNNVVLVVLLATQDGKLTRLELSVLGGKETLTNQLVLGQDDGRATAITKLVPSPSGRHWACANVRGELFILHDNDEIEESLGVALQIDTEAGRACSQLCWCGEDAIAATFPDLGLLIVGPKGDWIKYTFGQSGTSSVALVPELDCVRILTREHQELLQRVPAVIESCFRLGSTSPCAMLVDASELVQAGDARANETLRALKHEGELCNAVLDCIRAALGQFDVEEQQVLLRAAAQGKVFLGSSALERKQCTKAFARACSALRVLNVVRHGSIGIPITALQLEQAGGMCALALRLARYGHHFLACKVVHLSWASARERTAALQEISRLWAVQMITAARAQDDPAPVVNKIKRKLVVGFASLACEAFAQGKPELALSLADMERNITLRVTSLVRFGEHERALQVATSEQAGKDMELKAFVLSKMPRDAVANAGLLAGGNNKQACALFVERFTAEHAQFMQRGFVQTSVLEAIRIALLSSEEEEQALGIKRDFAVSDMAYWTAKVQALVARRDWVALERTARLRMQRLGVVIHACLLHGERQQALRFCDMVADEEERAEVLGECGEYLLAIDYIKHGFKPGNGKQAMALLDIKSKIILSSKLGAEERQVLLDKCAL